MALLGVVLFFLQLNKALVGRVGVHTIAQHPVRLCKQALHRGLAGSRSLRRLQIDQGLSGLMEPQQQSCAFCVSLGKRGTLRQRGADLLQCNGG